MLIARDIAIIQYSSLFIVELLKGVSTWQLMNSEHVLFILYFKKVQYLISSSDDSFYPPLNDFYDENSRLWPFYCTLLHRWLSNKFSESGVENISNIHRKNE